MASSSPEEEPHRAHRGAWRERTLRSNRRSTGERSRKRPLEIEGLAGGPIDLKKRIRLSNILAVWACAIMGPWLAVEALFGASSTIPMEVGFLAAFGGVLGLNAMHAHRAARLLLVVSANVTVFIGAVAFDPRTGGVLPFFALIALPLLLFEPSEWLLVVSCVALPPLLFVASVSGFAGHVLAVTARPAPPWYFAANATSAFAVAFVIPFLFYRSNLKAEASIERLGRQKLSRVIDSNLIGVVRGSLSGRIEEANDTFLRLLGHTRADLANGSLDLKAIAPLEPTDSGSVPAWSDLPGRSAYTVYERTCARKDGTCVPVMVGVAVLDDGLDEVVGFVLDLTAQKQMEAQNTLLRESREAIRLRDLFSSIASHELKTPLTALLLNLKTLRRRLDKDAPENETLRTQIDRCESSATRMGELIHTLLDVAQIHDGKLALSLDEMDVVEAVRRVTSGFELVRPAGGQEIQIQADGAVTARLDPLRFDQMLSNLLSNAIKYGAGKPIEVRVHHDGEANAAHIEVVDQGLGIEPTMTEKIFEPFQRAVSAEAAVPGLGLGLYVVKMIVEGHGGRINVDSRMGQGSRFIVELPCAPRSSAVPFQA